MSTNRKFGKDANPDGSDGGFKVLRRYGEPTPTRKDNERIAVQAVQVNSRKWLEARILFKSRESERWTPSKQAITFSGADQVTAFIDALEAGLVDSDSLDLFVRPEAPAIAEEEIEVVAVKPRHRAFAESALIPED